VKIFKHLYAVDHPLIDKYACDNVNNGIMKGLNSYDNIKSQAMNTHSEIEGNINNSKNSLAKKRYNFNIT